MKTVPVGLQLYTVRDMMAKDVPAALAAVKAAGYDYVEPAGLYGLSGEAYKAALDAAGLTAVCAHVPLADFGEDPLSTVKTYEKLGLRYLAVPYVPEELRYGKDAFWKTMEYIRKLGMLCHERGIQLVYHNHDFEFTKMEDGRYVLDYMYETIQPEYLATELDVCWVSVGGEDPAAYVRKYGNRAPLVHLKDYVGQKSAHMYELIGIKSDAKAEPATFEFRPVGAGVVNFPSVLAAVAESNAEYVIVEQDQSYAQTSIEAAKQSRNYLKSLGW